jgi:hypothetical protein
MIRSLGQTNRLSPRGIKNKEMEQAELCNCNRLIAFTAVTYIGVGAFLLSLFAQSSGMSR